METPTITIYNAKEFRSWLQKHHTTEKSVVILLHKRHTGKTAPRHRELLDEAICFGWIDTTVHRIDDDLYARKFVRRKDTGNWSENTLGYARELIKQGKMAPEGLRLYTLGKAKLPHDHGLPKDPPMPPELKAALAEDAAASAHFKTYPPSTTRMLYRWIIRAKLPATRTKRIAQIIAKARTGKRPL
jgi:uncharacterized protein YdeI (YjbR/CyaY-like superfamily)